MQVCVPLEGPEFLFELNFYDLVYFPALFDLCRGQTDLTKMLFNFKGRFLVVTGLKVSYAKLK